MDTSEASPSPVPPPLHASELRWKGRILSEREVARAFVWGSLAILALGVGLNYMLTDGEWYQGPADPNLRSYLRAEPYDQASALILGTSLLFLGAGFLAAYSPTLRNRWFQLAAALALVFLSLGLADRTTGGPEGGFLLNLVLASLLGFVALTWALATVLGPGRRMHYARGAGFVLFGFYWATQAMKLYIVEEGDFVNALFAGLAVFFFNYFAYHELLSIRRNEDPRPLQWLAGTAFLTTGVYFATHKLQPVSHWLILVVAQQTTWLLQFFGQAVVRDGGEPLGSMIYYPAPASEGYAWFPIQIILACTAIQSIMIFVGAIFALRPPRSGEGWSGRPDRFKLLRPSYQARRFYALLLTVPLIYVLNLLRNVIIIGMSGQEQPVGFSEGSWATSAVCAVSAETVCGPADAAFWFSHNIIGKGGSLVALIIIAFIAFQILPELYDSLIGLLDLKQRRGPLERWFRPGAGGGEGGRREPRPVASPAPSAATPVPAPDALDAR